MLAKLWRKLVATALVGMMWVGSHSGCDVNSAYRGGPADYYTGGGYVVPYGAVDYAPAHCCDSYDYYGGGYYSDDYSWW